MQRGAYVKDLPSTPQMARYTAAPSAYTDPTVSASPPAWWGSSLGGCPGPCGCGGCDGLSGIDEKGGMMLLVAGSAVAGFFVAGEIYTREPTRIYRPARYWGAFIGAIAGGLIGRRFL